MWYTLHSDSQTKNLRGVVMNEKDSAKMIRLAQEGKEISKIQRENFPEYSYSDVYVAVYADGEEQSSRGIKTAITRRLNKLSTLPPVEQSDVIDGIQQLATDLYEQHKASQKRLDQIRSIIEG